MADTRQSLHAGHIPSVGGFNDQSVWMFVAQNLRYRLESRERPSDCGLSGSACWSGPACEVTRRASGKTWRVGRR